MQVGTNVIKCHHVLGHGWQDLSQGFVSSCNPYFIQLIRLAWSSALYRMASAMSFNSALVLAPGFSTASGVFPDEGTLLQPAALANVSFGQGELTATPIHIAQMTASVVNGGSVYPARLLAGQVSTDGYITPEDEEPPIRLYSGQTAAALREMMCRVVEDGTGATARPEKGGAGGKTGTAETGWLSADGSTMVQSWFTGFYPAQDPQFVITVVSEDAGNSKKQAAPVFKVICDELYRLYIDKSDDR
jgi:cell division protein FtsI/penicillin-binding protein 2